MILKTMWVKGVDGEDHVPELMVAWDEYRVDDHPDGFNHECKQARDAWGTDLAEWRMVDIHLSEHAIEQAFSVAVTSGSVAPPEPEQEEG